MNDPKDKYLEKLENNFGVKYFPIDNVDLFREKLQKLDIITIKEENFRQPPKFFNTKFNSLELVSYSAKIDNTSYKCELKIEPVQSCSILIDQKFNYGKEVYAYRGNIYFGNEHNNDKKEVVFKLPKNKNFDYNSKIKAQLMAKYLADEYSKFYYYYYYLIT